MAPLIPDGALYVQNYMTCTGDSERMIFTTGWEVNTPPYTQGQADILVRSIADIFDDVVSSAYTFTGGRVTWGQAFDMIFDVTDAEGGNLGATALPQNCAALVRKITNVGGRRNHGRMYIPGLLEGTVDAAGNIDAATQTAWATATTALLNLPTAVPTANVSQGLLLHTIEPAAGTPITAYQLQPVIATQRRRLRP